MTAMTNHERIRDLEQAAYDVLESERDFLKKANAALASAYQSIADENAELRARCDELDKFNLSLATESHNFRTALEQFLACFNCSEWEDEPMVFAAMTAAREALKVSP